MPYARISTACLATVTAAAAVVALAGCGGGSPYKKTGVHRMLPSLSGQTLAAARATASGAGFGNVSVTDATGAKRSAASAADWRVCFQSPAAGTADTGVPVRLSVAKLTESCPARDGGAKATPSTRRSSMTHRVTKSRKSRARHH
ncbi:PASTA domain-containing protein [Streptomyces sp. NBC_01477]|uniref:PASTA domain-containing protein n=1 Tax=Streptomyces sp. NBC_01477 TaxID=2976015 RepID=UPI002E324430|nr:PASTA domain-containing protein [Streptomyces sp. NBC_01477]